MSVYRASSIKELLSKEILEKEMDKTIKDIDINLIETSGLSGSNLFKIQLKSDNQQKNLYLKVNNLKEDWLSRVSNDKGRELIIFKEDVYPKVKEFIGDVYIAYYSKKDSYALLMRDMSENIGSINNMDKYLNYLDNLARFHSKFRETDIYKYEDLLSVEKYYNFLSVGKFKQMDKLEDEVIRGWDKLKEILGEELYYKYNNLKDIDYLYDYYPKTFVHGDYRPDNTVYIDDKNINMIDFANSGCGPCTLDLFWYIMTSVDVDIDKIFLIDFYKNKLEEYIGYKYTKKTWNTLLEVGLLCACRMYLAALVVHTDYNNCEETKNLDWWIENLKFILLNRVK